MHYKVIFTENARRQLDDIMEYILTKLQSKQAAGAVLDDALSMIERLEYMAGAIRLCDDPYLAQKGYRKLPFDNHDYVVLYLVDGEEVYVNGIFHTKENYRKKL